MGLTILFGTIHESHCTISPNIYLYRQYFQQKVFSFSKISESQTDLKYFQTLVKQRRARSKILDLKTDEGIITEDYEVIESTLVNHFKNQFFEIGTSSFHS